MHAQSKVQDITTTFDSSYAIHRMGDIVEIMHRLTSRLECSIHWIFFRKTKNIYRLLDRQTKVAGYEVPKTRLLISLLSTKTHGCCIIDWLYRPTQRTHNHQHTPSYLPHQDNPHTAPGSHSALTKPQRTRDVT